MRYEWYKSLFRIPESIFKEFEERMNAIDTYMKLLGYESSNSFGFLACNISYRSGFKGLHITFHMYNRAERILDNVAYYQLSSKDVNETSREYDNLIEFLDDLRGYIGKVI